MLICSSTYCKKCKQCGRYIFNLSDKYKSQINTVEPLADFGWGSIGMNSQGETHCEVHTYCGFNGNYAMFEPIENSVVREGLNTNNKRMIDEKQIEEIVKETIYQNATSLVDDIDKQNNTHHYMLYDEDIFHIAKRIKEKLSEESVVLTKKELIEKYCQEHEWASKETAKECRDFIKQWVGNDEEGLGFLFDFENFIAKKYRVEVE